MNIAALSLRPVRCDFCGNYEYIKLDELKARGNLHTNILKECEFCVS